MNSKLKVFIMAVIGFVVTWLSTAQEFNLAQTLLMTVSFAGTYAIKNFFMPSDSPEGQVFWKDIVSGVVIALCMALSNLAATLLPGVEFSWPVLWTTIVGAVVGYFTKTLAQGKKV